MNTAYVIYVTAFLFSLAVVLSTFSISEPPTYYRSAVAQLICDICTVYKNPGSQIIGIYDFRGNTLRIEKEILILEKPFWIFPQCGRQEKDVVYLPIGVEAPLEISGLACLELKNTDGITVHISLCKVVGND